MKRPSSDTSATRQTWAAYRLTAKLLATTALFAASGCHPARTPRAPDLPPPPRIQQDRAATSERPAVCTVEDGVRVTVWLDRSSYGARDPLILEVRFDQETSQARIVPKYHWFNGDRILIKDSTATVRQVPFDVEYPEPVPPSYFFDVLHKGDYFGCRPLANDLGAGPVGWLQPGQYEMWVDFRATAPPPDSPVRAQLEKESGGKFWEPQRLMGPVTFTVQPDTAGP